MKACREIAVNMGKVLEGRKSRRRQWRADELKLVGRKIIFADTNFVNMLFEK